MKPPPKGRAGKAITSRWPSTSYVRRPAEVPPGLGCDLIVTLRARDFVVKDFGQIKVLLGPELGAHYDIITLRARDV